MFSTFTGRNVPSPDVQEHGDDVDSLFPDAPKQLGREVQPRGRRGGGALPDFA